MLLSLSAGTVEAAKMEFVFLYPGGQGSQEQAQPILDRFSEALKKASGGKIDASIKYFSNAQAGEQFIQTKKPAGGILAQHLFQEKGRSLQAQALLQTLQLPSGDGTNQYYLLSSADATLPASGPLKVFSPRPLSPTFVATKLFPGKNLQFEINATPNVVGKLRKIGKGEEKGWVLLDQFEYTTISRLKSPWAKNLKTVANSQKIPSAPFVIFNANISPDQVKELKTALLKLSKDSGAKEALGLLRLKGFR